MGREEVKDIDLPTIRFGGVERSAIGGEGILV
jgi:hypothetical protein